MCTSLSVVDAVDKNIWHSKNYWKIFLYREKIVKREKRENLCEPKNRRKEVKEKSYTFYVISRIHVSRENKSENWDKKFLAKWIQRKKIFFMYFVAIFIQLFFFASNEKKIGSKGVHISCEVFMSENIWTLTEI